MSKTRKIYVVDTNVFLFDPHAIFSLADHDIVIPLTVIEEVDKFKRDQTENGRNARQFSRILDSFRKSSGKHLRDGVEIKPGGGRLRVHMAEPKESDLPSSLSDLVLDNRILASALSQEREHPGCEVIMLTKDTNLRIKADAFGLDSEDYEPSNLDMDDLYSGVSSVDVPGAMIDEFMGNRVLREAPKKGLMPNEFVLLRNAEIESHTALGRWDSKKEVLTPLSIPGEGIWGIFPKNAEQTFAFDLLLNDDIQLVSLVGKAGTGKTLLAIAAGLVRTVDEGIYNRLLVSRPVFPLGRDIGYLPGDIGEKLNPWMQPIFDNLDYLFGAASKRYRRSPAPGRGAEELINQGMLSVEPLTYIRGRSIPQQFMIVDEAQNLTPHEIKTIITRAGDRTKIILTGDPYQIDNPYIDSASNGLAYVVERFKDQPIAGHVTLTKGERSELADLASTLL